MTTTTTTATKVSARDCLLMANDIIVGRNLSIPRLSSLKDINYAFFVHIFEDLFGDDDIAAIVQRPQSRGHEIQLMTRLLAYVSGDLFAIPLDHISPAGLVAGDLVAIHDFLEIIAEFLKYLPEEFTENNNNSNNSRSYRSTVGQ
ncbi:uncharacterized protein LOC128963863 [Oppia nitens]|uniref:uncharacterized protein LOC128963863 n=1 Tax=Oppia nitens TaxID=1686743 RepID=UPI0023DB5F8A|nr:uncharacterized protein LOC128963863 [Oppia nitens]